MTRKNNFYLPIINGLKESTNLSKIRENLDISKQQLNYYLRELKKEGYIYKKAHGWYEVTERSKNMTNHDSLLKKDSIRGHAYVWDIFPQEIKDWSDRIQKLKDKDIHFKLVGAKENTPRIKVLGRKVWLCNDKIKIYDIPKSSYYGENAIESRKSALNELLLVVGAIEQKLGINLRPLKLSFRKEHYALIKNDLAIDQNRKGIIWRIKDENGEWLLIDDSLEQGGELENVGKKSFETNIPMQKWWNEQKETGFKVTPNFILDSINKVTQNQLMFAQNIETHMEVLNEMSKTLKAIQESLEK